MRLSSDKVKAAILHSNQDVREAAVNYFSSSFSADLTIMPLVIQAIQQYGWQDAFEFYSFLEDLTQTDDTVRWLICQIKQFSPSAEEQETQFTLACRSALIHADPTLLERFESELMDLDDLKKEAKEAIRERIQFQTRPADELWRDLQEFCETHKVDMTVSDEDFGFACRLVEALGRHRKFLADLVHSILQANTGDFDDWMAGFAVRLAGELKLEAAIPYLIEMLHEDDDWIDEECHRALVKIGGESIASRFARAFPDADWKFRISAAYIMEDIHTDWSVRTCLDLAQKEEDQGIRGILLEALLRNCANEGIEPARQFILTTPLDPDVLELRTALLTACKVMNQRFPEFDAWLEDSKNDQEFRRQWFEEHPLSSEEACDDQNIEEEMSKDENDVDEPSFLPFVEKEAQIARNELFTEESDFGHSIALSGICSNQSQPKYPVGTVALYGPDDKMTTKMVAGVIKREGAEAIIERWVGTKVKGDVKVRRQIQEFFGKHGVKSVVATDGNIGCPHEEGDDFPVGEDCPFCPFWKGKQGSARRH